MSRIVDIDIFTHVVDTYVGALDADDSAVIKFLSSSNFLVEAVDVNRDMEHDFDPYC